MDKKRKNHVSSSRQNALLGPSSEEGAYIPLRLYDRATIVLIQMKRGELCEETDGVISC